MATFCFSFAQSGYAAAIIPEDAAVRSHRRTAQDWLICDNLKLKNRALDRIRRPARQMKRAMRWQPGKATIVYE
jgi:hypothetical protein